MSKKGFVPAAQPATKGEGPNIKINKLTNTNGAPVGDQTVGGASGTDYIFTGVNPGKIYMHPPSRLIKGRIIYHCKYLGHLRVPEPRGGKIVHDAVDKLKAVAAVNRANYESELKDVDLSVSTRSLVTVDKDTNKAIHQHPLPFISFSADDKRGKGNIFAYISRAKPPSTEYICYVYQCTPAQAQEITATVGQSFELAYKKFLETKQAQEDFKRLKSMLQTATPEEKVTIEEKLIQVNKIRSAEAERQKKMASMQAKMPEVYSKPVTALCTKGKVGSGIYTGSDVSPTVVEGGKDKSELAAQQVNSVQKEVNQLELDSEYEMQSKKTQAKEMKRANSSVTSKWENITDALEPFQLEPSMNPGTQHLVKRVETKELDSAITDIEIQIQELEDAFDWRRRKGQGPAPSLYNYEEEEVVKEATVALSSAIMDELAGLITATQIDADTMEVPDLPANYVMTEFIKAKEKAALPKKGTVKNAAGGWYQEHHD